jgi:hypothetical protein
MDTPSTVCIGFGILIIVGRAPLMFAPYATLRFYRRHFFSTDAQFRWVGLIAIMFAIAILYASLHAPIMGDLLQVFACVAALAALLVFGFPSLFQRFSLNILDYFNRSVHYGLARTHGFLGVIVGVALVYVGFYAI